MLITKFLATKSAEISIKLTVIAKQKMVIVPGNGDYQRL